MNENLRRRMDDRVTPISAGSDRRGHQARTPTDDFKDAEKAAFGVGVESLPNRTTRSAALVQSFPRPFLPLKWTDTPISSLVPFPFFLPLYTTAFDSL